MSEESPGVERGVDCQKGSGCGESVSSFERSPKRREAVADSTAIAEMCSEVEAGFDGPFKSRQERPRSVAIRGSACV